MQLNHLSLAVPKVVETRTFFETFFGFRCMAVKGNNALVVLEEKDHFTLVLSHEAKGEKPAYPTDFHIGFMLKTPDEVQQTYQNLVTGGIAIGREPKLIRNTLSFYFYAPGDFMVEVGCLV